MNSILQDLRYALRQLRKSPGFALTTIFTLALGIGSAAAVFSVIDATLLRPLPYANQGRIVTPDTRSIVGWHQPWSLPSYLDARPQLSTFEALAGYNAYSRINLEGPSGPVSLPAVKSTDNFFIVFGVKPILGRTYLPGEDQPGKDMVTVLSYEVWQRDFGGQPDAVGKIVRLDGAPYTVIGVMPSGFRFPLQIKNAIYTPLHPDAGYTVIGVMPASLATVESPDVWQPLQMSSKDPGYQGTNYQMIARLKPGASIEQASAELDNMTKGIFRQFPDYRKWGRPGGPKNQEFVWPLRQIVVSGARSSLLALSAAVLAVLLMACLNLAGLMTARSIARRSEVALRTALGASRATVLRLLLTESLVLAFVGSLLGLALAQATVPILLTSSPIDLPQLHHASIDLAAILFAIGAGCATTLLFGLVPALGIFRPSLSSGLGNVRTAGESAPQQRMGKSLIVAQVALATTLLSAGALLLSVFVHLRSVPLGVRPQHMYVLQVNLKGNAYNSSLHTEQFISAVEQRLRAIPGVAKVATISGLPLDRGLNNSGGPAGHPEQIGYTETRFVTPGYFSAAGSTLLAGNNISDADTATSQPVALINERAAKRWFPNRSPIGEYIVSGGGKPRRVIGLVANVHDSSLVAGIAPTVYTPYTQVDDETMKTINGWFPTTFILRTVERGNTPDPDIAAAASAAIAAVDPEVPASKFAPMQSFIDHDVAAPRFFSWLASAFALFALGLTLIGLFGLLSYQVASRTRELGVRMALGAQRYQVLLLILNSGLTLTVMGLVLGVAGSVALRGVVISLLSDTVGISKTSSLLGAEALP